jgi:hypothetical protein
VFGGRSIGKYINKLKKIGQFIARNTNNKIMTGQSVLLKTVTGITDTAIIFSKKIVNKRKKILTLWRSVLLTESTSPKKSGS